MSQRWNRLNRNIIHCDQCPRLTEHCQKIATVKRKAYANEDYWGKPVPNFGDPRAQLLLVGLAPGAHGANRTGRIFTGDRSGDWLYQALFTAGFATQPESIDRQDNLELKNCAITNVCHCAPPENKPSRQEILNCQSWATDLINMLPVRVFLALGQIAWRSVIDYLRDQDLHHGSMPKFSHGATFQLEDGRILLGSYHPSQQNTFTGRLTREMFDEVFVIAKEILHSDTD